VILSDQKHSVLYGEVSALWVSECFAVPRGKSTCFPAQTAHFVLCIGVRPLSKTTSMQFRFRVVNGFVFMLGVVRDNIYGWLIGLGSAVVLRHFVCCAVRCLAGNRQISYSWTLPNGLHINESKILSTPLFQNCRRG